MGEYSKKELAEVLGVIPRTIVNWTKLKDSPLPFRKRLIYETKKPWEYVFDEDQVKQWIESKSFPQEPDQ